MRTRIAIALLVLSSCQIKPTDCNLTSNLCSCDRRSASEYPDCRDYEAISREEAGSKCTAVGGTFSQSALCPTETRVGTCLFSAGSQNTYQRYYLAQFSTAVSAAGACAYYKLNCFAISGNAICDGVWTSDI